MQSITLQQRLKPPFNLLKFTFVIAPVVAGIVKFTNLLTHWEYYLNPSIISILLFSAFVFMMIVGVIEIIAGIIVQKMPEIGGYIVAAWLTAIALTLLAGFRYADIAIRDLVMAITAFCNGKNIQTHLVASA